MELKDALSLAEFINDRGTRFHAYVLDFGVRGWVILADRQDQRYLEPVADARDYVRRADLGMLQIDADCRDLIDAWVLEQ